jgi:hypothetical protein
MKLFLGIDPGIEGALVFINADLAVVEQALMPVLVHAKGARRKKTVDEVGVRDLLTSVLAKHQLVLTTLESLMQGHPGLRGVNSALTMGANHGLLRGVLTGLRIPYLLTPPKRWQSALFDGTGDPKAQSVERARQLFPTLDLTPGQRTKPHDGLSDAALLAYYGMGTMG